MDKIKKLAQFFFEASALKKNLRAHQPMLLTFDPTDNVASHSFITALMGYLLAIELGADESKVMKMCLFHDLAEVRSGDINWVHKKYVKVFEDEIRNDQLVGLLNKNELLGLLKEYEERQTKEAKIAKDADQLAEVFSLREYAWQGNREAAHWLHEDEGEDGCQQIRLMHYEISKRIAQEAIKQKPSDWWENAWTHKNR